MGNDNAIEKSQIEILLVRQIQEAPELLRQLHPGIGETSRRGSHSSRACLFARREEGEEKKALGLAISELKNAIRKHRDTQMSKLPGPADAELYRVLD